MIAYYYPPLGGIGALRPLHFSKYLEEFGWNTTVVSVSNESSYIHDESLLDLVPAKQRIVRAYRPPVFNTIRKLMRKNLRSYPLAYSLMDAQFDWVPSAIRAGSKLLKEKPFDAILATAPPYSTIRVARALKKRFGIPAVADLRDPFTINPMKWPSRYHKSFYSIYWRKILKDIDRAIVLADFVSEHLVNNLGLAHLKPVLIPNGYDPSDFAIPTEGPPADRFVLGYFGSIYGKLSPRPLFESLALALSKRPEMRGLTEVIFMGNMDQNYVIRLAKTYGIERMVRTMGFRPHSEAISTMRRCHVLLLFTGMVYRSASGKIFEYAATGRPVLSFGVQRYTRAFIAKNRFGFSVNGECPEEGAAKIIELFDLFSQGRPIQGPVEMSYSRYSRRELTRCLASVLDSL